MSYDKLIRLWIIINHSIFFSINCCWIYERMLYFSVIQILSKNTKTNAFKYTPKCKWSAPPSDEGELIRLESLDIIIMNWRNQLAVILDRFLLLTPVMIYLPRFSKLKKKVGYATISILNERDPLASRFDSDATADDWAHSLPPILIWEKNKTVIW